MTISKTVDRLRAALPGWAVDLEPDPAWWGLDNDYHPPRQMVRITSPDGAVGLLDPRTRRHGVIHAFGRSWQNIAIHGRGWVERYAALLAANP